MKNLVILLLLFLCGTTVAQKYSGDPWSEVKKSGAGTISMAYVETPGFVYKGEDGKLTGICVDMMNDFVKWANETKGVKLTSKFVGDGSSFKGMFEKVKGAKGGVFGLGNITITEERKREVKFTPSFITNSAILITQSSVPTLKKLEDIGTGFAGFTAYTAQGTMNDKRITELKQKYFNDLTISYTTSSQEALEKVFADPKGFAYLDMAFYLEAVQLKKDVKRHPSGDKMAEEFGIIMPSSSDWGPLFEEFVKSNGGYFNSKQYKALLVKHLGDAGLKLMKSVAKNSPAG
jgi:ABC-type amino acid transport substrate-binding protein